MKITLSLLLVIAASCSFKKGQLENQTLKGHTELYSSPSAPNIEKLGEFEKRIVIASTNDIHGNYQTQNIAFTDDFDKKLQSTPVGGIDVIQNYFKILRETYENVILVDSGDIFARANSTNTVKDFYQLLNYDALTVGLSDFNLQLPSHISSSAELFKRFAKSSPTPLLLSNLYDLKSARVVEWEGTKPYVIKEVGGVKVGIIGLVPDDIVFQTPVNNRVGLFVENMLQSTLRNARLLRSLGAELVVVITHQGIDCNSELATEAKLPQMKVNFEPKRSKCDLKNALGQYLERLPPQLVDVVIGGRNHQKMANFVNGTLVLGSYPDGKSFSYAEFRINTKDKKVIPEQTIVHQPVMFCHEFFSETKDCFTEDPSVNHKEKIPAMFLGKSIGIEKTSEPTHDLTTSVEHISDKEIARSLVNFTAHIAYTPDSSGNTQLFVVAMNGRDLTRVLEEDFNRGHKTQWKPSPYLVKKSELILSVSGQEIDDTKTYRILTDLESLQRHTFLLRNITHDESQSLANHSWATYQEHKNSITTRMAAPTR